ncbi:hypothetical protein BYT27DRAFT_7256149 [Phlegmacium glaucopus]|nr:hypothetical protein BYT27DRAFT_7256149 [Phlegmacium glaucopus]
MSMSPNLTTEPTFTPRKEFIRIPIPAPDSFALLALSSSNCIRLYSFPASVVDALRRLFEQLSVILSSREDLPQSICEFALDGKPWANAKSVSTEKLLLDILAVVYQCGYSYLSTIDYGRENDDRLAMVFSKPGTSISRTPNPLPAPMPTITSLNDKEQVQRVPFAISFASATLMRVIAPPLHLTPAILQAVRASWPRGVVSEKKVGDNSFEFKLKGYKWFQQDTFATDSLRHILALLTSLDSHSFSLLTSISLTNHSRVKDLWIFTGPTPEGSLLVETPELPSLNIAVPDIRRLPLQGFSDEANHPIDAQQRHQRVATEPTAHLPFPQHSRSTTDGPQRPQYPVSQSLQPHFLRKPAPRARVPVSVFKDSDISDEYHPILRAHMPSTISAGVDNMTGVGTVGLIQDVLSTSSPSDIPPMKVGGPAAIARSDLRLGSDGVGTPPLLTSTSPNKTPQSNAKDEKLIPSTNDFSPQPLLGMNAFRDSAFSSNTAAPLTWTGSYKEDAKLEQEKPRLNPSYSSNGPIFPGDWQSTPVNENLEEESEISTPMPEEKWTASTPIHENDCHIEAPAMIAADVSLRKSEAALVGIIASTSHVPSIPQRDKSSTKESQNTLGSGGQGWVLINVEGSNATRPVLGSDPIGDATASRTHESKGSNSPLASVRHASKSPAPEQPSPAAKAIVIIDAIDSKRKKRSTMQPKESHEGSTGLKRFFSLKKDLGKAPEEKRKDNPTEVEASALKSIPRSRLRDRLRLVGTPKASRREGERRSID